jgi:hypothetical protein
MKWLACLAVAFAVAAGASAQTPAATQLPTVTSFTLPVLPQIYRTAKVEGSFKVLVTTDGRQVIDVREVAIERQEMKRNSPLLAHAVDAAVRTWQFAPHSPRSFELTVRAPARRDPDSCRDFNSHVVLHLPIEVVIEYSIECLIHYSVEHVRGTLTVRQVRGVVRDELNGNPVSSAFVSLLSNEISRFGETDEHGAFDLGPVPLGRYSLQAGGSGYGHRGYTVVVKKDVSAHVPLVLELHKYRDVTPVPPTATVADVALYPLDLRDAGVSGDVRLQVAADGQVTALDGPKALTEAALSNLKTWKWERLPKRGITVTYHYRLLPGDCTGDNGPFVTARYPFDVDIAMKRAVPCGSSPRE